jgi:hypothetical protein
MLFPTDPAARPSLMTVTLNLLSGKPQIVVVVDGRACCASIKRVDSSRDFAIGPVWAFDTVGDTVELKLCTLQRDASEQLDERRWASEVQTIVMNIEFEERAILELRFPLRFEWIECQGWEKHDDHGGFYLA